MMKLISVVLVLPLLFALPVLSAPPLHSLETRNNEQTLIIEAAAQPAAEEDTGSLTSNVPAVISVLKGGDTDTGSVSVTDGNKNEPLGQKIADYFHNHKWMYGIMGVCVLVIVVAVVLLIIGLCCCWRNQKCKCGSSLRGRYHRVALEDSSEMNTESHQVVAERIRPKRPLKDTPEDNALRFFLNNNGQLYVFSDDKLDDLGSRRQKSWYAATLNQGEEHKRVILTVAPLPPSCPLEMHKHQKGLNKLLGAIKVHPFIHQIFEVAYLATHERVVIAQPKMTNGSLKDLIYKVEHPTLDWSQKYSSRSKGLSPEKVARYGRQVLEAVEFLYDKGFPTSAVGHIQSGNIFVVDDVCKLGGYENTLLGYKTRIYRICKDHLDHFDTILFGHLIFEMSAGYELTQLVPVKDDYKTVHKSIVPILEFIFDDNLSRSISSVKEHTFFDVSLPQLEDFNPDDVQISESMRVVLEKVRKNKPRVQKPPSAKLLKMTSPTCPTDGELSDHPQAPSARPGSWKDRFHMPKFLVPTKKKRGERGVQVDDESDVDDDDEPLLKP